MKFYITDQTKAEIENRIRSINKNMHEMDMITFDIDIDKSVREKDRKEIEILKEILSNSAPLIPEIDKAYWAGMQFIGEDKGSPIEYFSNLKLDI